MGWFEAIVLGVVQGLTEFLPISSSAHQLIVGQLFFGGRDPGAAFTAVSQLGTETAVLIFFWRDIVRIISRWAQSLVGRVPRDDFDARMGWYVIVGSVPIVVLGVLFQHAIDSTLRNLWITVFTLGGVGIVLGIADRYAETHQFKNLHGLNWRDAIVYGLCQAAALVPGVSRSGGTIAGGLFLRYDRPSATRYAFLLAIPAVFGSGVYKLKDIGSDPCVAWGPTILATVIAFVIGYLVIGWLLRYITTHTFAPFVIYRVALAIVVAILLVIGVLKPDAVLPGCGA